MPSLITIRDWDKHFEKAQSRKIEGPLPWVALPTKHDGKGYRRVMAAGVDVYAVWVVLVQIGAKCKRRGVLADEAGPLTTFDIHLKSSVPEETIERAIPILASKEIAWVCVSNYQSDGSEVVIEDSTVQDSTEQDRTLAPPAGGCLPPELARLIGWWNDLRVQGLVQAGVSADPPSEAVRRGWNRVQGSALLREQLADLEKLTSAIRNAPICRDGWFRLEKLLGGKNRDGEFIVAKLLEGGYADRKPKQQEFCGRFKG